MGKLNIAILFGGNSPEHKVSLLSAQSILNHINTKKYQVFPIGITKEGVWYYYQGSYDKLPEDQWLEEKNCRAVISPVPDEGLVIFTEEGCRVQKLDCVFPVLHGENGEDGSIQGLMQLAKIPCVGPGVRASAASMDKTLTKLVADQAEVRQAKWMLVRFHEFCRDPETILEEAEIKFTYPVFVKPAGTGSSVGVSKISNRSELKRAIEDAGKFDSKILIEEFIDGHEVEVAVLGNEEPITSCCGEIVSHADFYDYKAKYISDSAELRIPAQISEKAEKKLRNAAVKIYKALGCKGLSRADFFVTYTDDEVVFNEINTLPGFTSISMYPKLFDHSGIPYTELIDQIIEWTME